MIKTRDYFMHQTPRKLAKDLIADIDFTNVKVLYEPFSGENAFYDNFPNGITKHRTEITDGLDFQFFEINANQIDTIITNPPYQLNGKNAYFSLIMYFFSIHFSRKKNNIFKYLLEIYDDDKTST